jgi:hypothetical protein
MNEYQSFLVDSMARGIEDVRDTVRFFPPDAVDRPLRPGEWTLREHLTHMRIVEERYLERLNGILASGDYVPSPAPQGTQVSGEPLDAVLDAYVAAGRALVDVYRGLADLQWGQVFNHPTIWGDVTIEWWAHQVIQHAYEHLDELWTLRKFAGLTPEALARVTAPSPA